MIYDISCIFIYMNLNTNPAYFYHYTDYHNYNIFSSNLSSFADNLIAVLFLVIPTHILPATALQKKKIMLKNSFFAMFVIFLKF